MELPAVLWSLRTTPDRSTGFTPFFLTLRSEAVLPSNLHYGAQGSKPLTPTEPRKLSRMRST
jgi:hypothetical protein